jgi:hypothetical protein
LFLIRHGYKHLAPLELQSGSFTAIDCQPTLRGRNCAGGSATFRGELSFDQISLNC